MADRAWIGVQPFCPACQKPCAFAGWTIGLAPGQLVPVVCPECGWTGESPVAVPPAAGNPTAPLLRDDGIVMARKDMQ